MNRSHSQRAQLFLKDKEADSCFSKNCVGAAVTRSWEPIKKLNKKR